MAILDECPGAALIPRDDQSGQADSMGPVTVSEVRVAIEQAPRCESARRRAGVTERRFKRGHPVHGTKWCGAGGRPSLLRRCNDSWGQHSAALCALCVHVIRVEPQ
jgi:hypothetical protein